MNPSDDEQADNLFDDAATEVVELGNRLLQMYPDADPWDVAAGMFAGAVHFWLYSHQPCDDPHCDSCTAVDTAEKRLRLMHEELDQSAQESEYFHTPNDANVGRA